MSTPILGLFKEQLENESRALATKHGLQRRGDYLIWWYFLKLVGLAEAEVDEIVCDGSADLGIDAIWIDEEDVVHFYTFKNPESMASAFPGGEVDKAIGGLNVILARKHQEIANEDLRGRIEEIYQTVPTGYRLHIVTSGDGISSESQTKLHSFVDALAGPSADFFRWDLEDIKKLQDAFYQKHLPTVDSPIDFQLDFSPYQVRSANHDSYIFHAKAIDLSALYETHGEQLLQQNIRVYQGDNATNSLIHETATGLQSANFLHYNNGVTFLCESAQWDGFTRKLTLKKAQVVNGGQTVRVLKSARNENKLRADVSTIVRVITSQGDKEFANNVAVNLNNQNRIEPSFLRSNEPRVMQLASALASMGWYLERRESEVDNLTASEKQAIEAQIGSSLSEHVIRLKEGAQAYVATYMRQPELAKKNPKKIFLSANDGGYFDRVFNSDLTAEKFVTAQQVVVLVNEYVRQFMTRKRRKERVEDWRKEYAELLGHRIMKEHADVLGQVVPQSAVFLAALVFDLRVRAQGKAVEELLSELSSSNDLLNELVCRLIDIGKSQRGASRSWPTLLKSQAFFENVASFARGGSAQHGQASLPFV
jgi:hypothetical protein